LKSARSTGLIRALSSGSKPAGQRGHLRREASRLDAKAGSRKIIRRHYGVSACKSPSANGNIASHEHHAAAEPTERRTPANRRTSLTVCSRCAQHLGSLCGRGGRRGRQTGRAHEEHPLRQVPQRRGARAAGAVAWVPRRVTALPSSPGGKGSRRPLGTLQRRGDHPETSSCPTTWRTCSPSGTGSDKARQGKWCPGRAPSTPERRKPPMAARPRGHSGRDLFLLQSLVRRGCPAKNSWPHFSRPRSWCAISSLRRARDGAFFWRPALV